MPFKVFEPSPEADSIYHCSLFNIGGRVWAISGKGKTEAARLACANDSTKFLTEKSSVAFMREADTLFARQDVGAAEEGSRLPEFYKVDVVAYCLNEKETAAFARTSKMLISEVGNELVAAFMSDLLYPAELAPYLFTPPVLHYLNDPLRRLKRLQELTRGVVTTNFVFVPYMATVAEKVNLYGAYQPGSGPVPI